MPDISYAMVKFLNDKEVKVKPYPGGAITGDGHFFTVPFAYDEYVYHWTSAIFGQTPTGAVVNADSNGDGTVSVKEAHNYAVAHDSLSKHPQIGSCINNAGDAVL